MVLDHVADRSSLIVKSSPALHAEVLCHRDLNALDVIAVPKRFHKRVGEAERQNIVHSALAEIVVDAKDVGFIECPKQNSIQFLRRCEVMAERLFHNDASASSTV